MRGVKIKRGVHAYRFGVTSNSPHLVHVMVPVVVIRHVRERGGANAYQFRITSESLYLVHSYMYMVPVVRHMRDDYTVAQERES